MAHRGGIGEVLRPARGELVCNEVFSGDIPGWKIAINHDRYAIFVNCGEVYSRDTLDHFEADGRNSESANRLTVGEVLYREFAERRTEFGEAFVGGGSVGCT